MYDVTVEFPKFKVGVATREGVVTQLKYLPLSAPSVTPVNDLARRAESVRDEDYWAICDATSDDGFARALRVALRRAER